MQHHVTLRVLHSSLLYRFHWLIVYTTYSYTPLYFRWCIVQSYSKNENYSLVLCVFRQPQASAMIEAFLGYPPHIELSRISNL